MKRDFQLPENDIKFLETLGLRWETVMDGSQLWLLVHDWSIPSGYTVSTSTLALSIPPVYPEAGLDMVYFYPALHLKNGRSIIALTNCKVIDKTFQRWSRHYTAKNPWRIGEDDLSTHLILIDKWLLKEVKK